MIYNFTYAYIIINFFYKYVYTYKVYLLSNHLEKKYPKNIKLDIESRNEVQDL